MVDQSTHCDSLLLAARQNVVPVVVGIEAVILSSGKVAQLNDVKDFLNIIIGFTGSTHLLDSLWINDLVSESSLRQVGSLRNVED